jgi:hypothetical protein
MHAVAGLALQSAPTRPAASIRTSPASTSGRPAAPGFASRRAAAPPRAPAPPRATMRFTDFGAGAGFELSEEARGALDTMLTSASMCAVVAQEAQLAEGVAVEFSGMLFQPVPWSPTSQKGMPQEFEQYQASDDYVLINVPPQVMFKAKVFKPSRLCAIYKKLA